MLRQRNGDASGTGTEIQYRKFPFFSPFHGDIHQQFRFRTGNENMTVDHKNGAVKVLRTHDILKRLMVFQPFHRLFVVNQAGNFAFGIDIQIGFTGKRFDEPAEFLIEIFPIAQLLPQPNTELTIGHAHSSAPSFSKRIWSSRIKASIISSIFPSRILSRR